MRDKLSYTILKHFLEFLYIIFSLIFTIILSSNCEEEKNKRIPDFKKSNPTFNFDMVSIGQLSKSGLF